MPTKTQFIKPERVRIGTKYKDPKTGRIFEVADIFTIYNSKGEICRRYCSACSSVGGVPITAGEIPLALVCRYCVEP